MWGYVMTFERKSAATLKTSGRLLFRSTVGALYSHQRWGVAYMLNTYIYYFKYFECNLYLYLNYYGMAIFQLAYQILFTTILPTLTRSTNRS
jgi:hypothetical protein